MLDPSSATTNTQSIIVRIYADGIFDLFHYGHARAFEKAKHLFVNVHLIVGICRDDDCLREKGRLPVMASGERAECVRHCRWVDEIVEEAPWIIDAEFMKIHRVRRSVLSSFTISRLITWCTMMRHIRVIQQTHPMCMKRSRHLESSSEFPALPVSPPRS